MSVRFTGFACRWTEMSLLDTALLPQHSPWCMPVHDECNSVPSEFIFSCLQDHEVVNLHLSTATPPHPTHTQKFKSNSIHLSHSLLPTFLYSYSSHSMYRSYVCQSGALFMQHLWKPQAQGFHLMALTLCHHSFQQCTEQLPLPQ